MIFSKKIRHQSIKSGHSSTNIQAGDGSTVTVLPISQKISSPTHITNPINIDKKGGVIYLAHINEGDYQEFIWGASTVRVAIDEIVKEKFYFSRLLGEKETHGAIVDISTGGGLVYGGSDCKKIGVNKYLIPLNEMDDEEPCSVYAYHVSKTYFDFFRVYVDHINPHGRRATLNLFFADIRNIKSS